MDYQQPLNCHYKPRKGWINDPNGLVFFQGYYHIFYQHIPDHEAPVEQPMHWGHARTRDFLYWEELPVALYPDQPYDNSGCWSGTAIEKDGVLYLFYASGRLEPGAKAPFQTVSMAWSTDGIHFTKHPGNPIIAHYPPDGGPDFRDPAVCPVNGRCYCVIASGNPEHKAGRLLLYRSDDLIQWDYLGIMGQWDDCMYTECPSLVPAGDQFLLATSVCPLTADHYFTVMYGDFQDGRFTPRYTGQVDKGPDQYAGQIYHDPQGRNILITWLPGWSYAGYREKDVGCMSVPRELKLVDGKITGYPVEEVRHLLKDTDPALIRTDTGFIIPREGREPVVYEGEIRDLKLIRDGYILEVFLNGGEEIYAVLL